MISIYCSNQCFKIICCKYFKIRFNKRLESFTSPNVTIAILVLPNNELPKQ